jgi:hypothetical protein
VSYWQRDNNWLPPALIGWSILVAVLEITVRLAVFRRRTAGAGEGPAAAFLLLGAWLTCFHFMYYDVLLTVLPAFVLLADWRSYLKPRLITWPRGAVDTELRPYYEPRRASTVLPPFALLEAGHPRIWVANSLVLTLIAIVPLSMYAPGVFGRLADAVPPFDTYCLMGLWFWCGWLWLKSERQPHAAWLRPHAAHPVSSPRPASASVFHQ